MGKGFAGGLVLAAAAASLLAVSCGGGKNGISANASVDVGGDGTAPKNASAAEPSEATTAASPTPAPAQPPPPPVTVTFTKSAPAAGMAHVVRSWVGLRMLFSVDHGGAPITTEHVSGELDERREDILTAVNGATTKVKVSFLHKQQTVVENGVEKTRPSVVAGKAYLVESKDGSLFITTDQGRRVSQAEGDTIAPGYEDLGRPDPVFASFPERPIAVGENVDAVVAGIEDAVVRGSQGHVGFGAMSVTLSGTRNVGGQGCGVFAVHLQMAYKLEKVENRSDMTGELVVRTADTQPVSLSLQGPVLMGGETAHADVEGQGEARVEVTWSQP